MRYAILSDVHATLFALRAVLGDAAGRYDQLLCLGDVVGYGAHPNECCALLRGAGARPVMGNHDAAALGQIDVEWFNEMAQHSAMWTREVLSPDNWAWLGRAEETIEIRQGEDEPFLLTHGNLEEPFYETYILNVGEAFAEFERLAQRGVRLCFFGHTHRAIAYRMAAPYSLQAPVQAMPLLQGGTLSFLQNELWLVNPGSVGQPRDGNPQARYALFDAARQEVEVRAVKYDIEAARHAIIQAHLYVQLGDRLRTGR